MPMLSGTDLPTHISVPSTSFDKIDYYQQQMMQNQAEDRECIFIDVDVQ